MAVKQIYQVNTYKEQQKPTGMLLFVFEVCCYYYKKSEG